MKYQSTMFDLTNSFVAISIVMLVISFGSGDVSQAMDHIDYHGFRVRLNRNYQSFEEYKNDDDQIHTESLHDIQGIMRRIQIPQSFNSRKELHSSISEFAFPGYGITYFEGIQGKNFTFYLFSFEIPADDDRYLLFLKKENSQYALVDDFICPKRNSKIDISFESNESTILYKVQNNVFRRFHVRF